MDMKLLFETQRKLDDHIMDEHPELKGQNNLDWKILALQVELGECANEWRCFKKWSKDKKPRIGVLEQEKDNLGNVVNSRVKNPLLEEYVDGLHFILSIGLELDSGVINVDYQIYGYVKSAWNTENTIKQFNTIFKNITDFSSSYDEFEYIELVSEFLGLGQMLGFTKDQIEQAYWDKNAVNHQRQENNY